MLAGKANSANLMLKLLTPAVMVDNLAKKVDECPLNLGHYICIVVYTGSAKEIRYTE